ncbi:hypothetical protein BN128_14 [Cronobacter sakazakii 696]|nr:hypothetical protein BN129_4015 [Cronobacter sakazakii 701]CCK06221.1 hypothetical protein BN128_14 [Cronobacter sakazakii 696]
MQNGEIFLVTFDGIKEQATGSHLQQTKQGQNKQQTGYNFDAV